MKSKGIVENAVLIGAPVSNDTKSWSKVRSMVANRLVNAYSSKDWALRLLFRADQFALGCAGLSPVLAGESLGVEQVDTEQPHFALRKKLGETLCRVVEWVEGTYM